MNLGYNCIVVAKTGVFTAHRPCKLLSPAMLAFHAASVPDSVKAELLQRIRTFIASASI